jgi:hypothetical protein
MDLTPYPLSPAKSASRYGRKILDDLHYWPRLVLGRRHLLLEILLPSRALQPPAPGIVPLMPPPQHVRPWPLHARLLRASRPPPNPPAPDAFGRGGSAMSASVAAPIERSQNLHPSHSAGLSHHHRGPLTFGRSVGSLLYRQDLTGSFQPLTANLQVGGGDRSSAPG